MGKPVFERTGTGSDRGACADRRRTLRLPDLDHSKLAVLNSLGSPDQFIAWYRSEPRLAFNRIVVTRYRMYLESRGLAANTINLVERGRVLGGPQSCFRNPDKQVTLGFVLLASKLLLAEFYGVPFS